MAIDSVFITEFTDEVHLGFQQEVSKLQGLVRTHRNVGSSTYKFPTLAAVTANTKARNADVTGREPTQAFVTVTLADYYAPIYLDKLDAIKTNADYKKEYVKTTVSAINRKVDSVIITAAITGANVIPTTTGNWTFAKHLEAIKLLADADAYEDERFFVMGPKQLQAMLNETKLTSADYVSIMPVVTGGIGSLFGMPVVLHTGLPLVSTSRQCFMANKRAVGCAVGQDPTTEINYIAQKASWLVNTMVSLGAVLIEAVGVAEVPCDES